MTAADIARVLEQASPEVRLVFAFLDEQRAAAEAQRAAAEARIAELLARIGELSGQIAQLQRMLFGVRSEKLPPVARELRQEPEVTLEGQPLPEAGPARQRELDRHARRKSEPERKRRAAARRKALPVEDIHLEVAEGDLPPGTSRADFRPMGTASVVERIAYVPAHFVLRRYHRKTLVHRQDDSLIVTARLPPGVVEGGRYEGSVYARVVVSKCADSMPLARQERAFARQGIDIARSSLCRMFHTASEHLQPLYEHLAAQVRAAEHLHADETTLPVQREPRAVRGRKRGPCKRSWVWMLLSRRGVVYAYNERRAGEVGDALVGRGRGTLMVDGYSGYNGAVRAGRTRVGCWAHARRKFFDARAANPEEAAHALDRIRALYRVEQKAAEQGIYGTAAHLACRRDQSKPIVTALIAWARKEKDRHPPKGPLAAALGYLTNQEEALSRFLDDPKLPLDNNIAERALRIIALGRKNFLFAGHDAAAQNLAILQSLVSTCLLHGVDPEAYLADVLVRLHSPGLVPDDLMPWNWRPPPS